MTEITAEQIEQELFQLLDDASNTTLGLTENDSDYNLTFVQQKLALCSTHQERLSDIMMRLTRISIEVQRKSAALKAYLDVRVRSLKQSQEYNDQSRENKTAWLEEMVKVSKADAEKWNTLRRVVSEIKEATSERASTMKRLDSDLRLHAKLLDMVPMGARGATGSAPTRGGVSEVDLD